MKRVYSELAMAILESVLAVVVALIPTWVFLAARAFFAPDGFWQELALGVVGLTFLGVIQLVLVVVLVAFLFVVWNAFADGIPRARRP